MSSRLFLFRLGQHHACSWMLKGASPQRTSRRRPEWAGKVVEAAGLLVNRRNKSNFIHFVNQLTTQVPTSNSDNFGSPCISQKISIFAQFFSSLKPFVNSTRWDYVNLPFSHSKAARSKSKKTLTDRLHNDRCSKTKKSIAGQKHSFGWVSSR